MIKYENLFVILATPIKWDITSRFMKLMIKHIHEVFHFKSIFVSVLNALAYFRPTISGKETRSDSTVVEQLTHDLSREY